MGQFIENTAEYGISLAVEVEEKLMDKQTKYQHLQVFKTKKVGMMMVLDGMIQSTEMDEFAYHEMMVHVPMTCHPNPKNILIIGGGDGGIVRELLKHESVEKITLVDIDGDVVDASKKYFPHLSSWLDDPKVTVLIEDGVKFVSEKTNEYDVIITDSSDFFGPAAEIFNENYFVQLHRALKPGGIICNQGEQLYWFYDLVCRLMTGCKKIFGNVSYSIIQIPTYPCGHLSAILCSKADESGKCCSFKKPLRKISNDKLQYYNEQVHSSSFVLPEKFRRQLVDILPDNGNN